MRPRRGSTHTSVMLQTLLMSIDTCYEGAEGEAGCPGRSPTTTAK